MSIDGAQDRQASSVVRHCRERSKESARSRKNFVNAWRSYCAYWKYKKFKFMRINDFIDRPLRGTTID
ncbi:hypothetical protein [Burkholderia dolosa]|uniref:hypothetical protein n=1 Tax=Burkholderia dolosa TaxID=152500 RepID=UPI0027D28B1F|nr:hypothetical protein [Burkholderia dolosa]